MDLKLEKTTLDWVKTYFESKILYAGATDMLLQFICDLNIRRIEPTVKAFLDKREASIKKHGVQNDDGSWLVKQFLDEPSQQNAPESDEQPEKKEPGEREEAPSYKAFRAEVEPLETHKVSITVDSIELSLLKGQNPREFAQLFAQVGAEFGIFNFKEIYTLTDKFAQSGLKAE